MMEIHQDQLIEWDKLLIQQYISLLPPEIWLSKHWRQFAFYKYRSGEGDLHNYKH